MTQSNTNDEEDPRVAELRSVREIARLGGGQDRIDNPTRQRQTDCPGTPGSAPGRGHI